LKSKTIRKIRQEAKVVSRKGLGRGYGSDEELPGVARGVAMNPRTPISDLKLTASPNLTRALKREKADAEKPPLSEAQKSELAQVDELIQQAFKACRRGQTIKRKANPAFRHLQVLFGLRDRILARRDPENQASEIMNEIDLALREASKWTKRPQ
jgi:hypothetical protein